MSLKGKITEVQFPANKHKLSGKVDNHGLALEQEHFKTSELGMVEAIALLLVLALGGTLVGCSSMQFQTPMSE